MAEKDGQSDLLEATTPEQVLAAGGVSRRRRNLSNKAGERIRNPHSKSPKRRAGTPEPERRAYTDESERDVSDTENLKNVQTAEEKKKWTPGRSRVLVKSKDHGETIRRTRSTERPPTVDTTTEIEDDFEIIRQIHKAKELEEEEIVTKAEEPKPRPKEEPKEFVPKEMPPLIIAPKDTKETVLKKRPRPKTLTLPISEEDKPKTVPRSKSKTRLTKRKVSTSEEEEDAGGIAVKGKLTLKPKSATEEKPIKAEPRKKKLLRKAKKDDKKDISESEGPETEPEKEKDDTQVEKVDAAPESKGWFFQRWFSWGKKPVEEEAAAEPEEKKKEEEKEPEKVEEEKPVEEVAEEKIEEKLEEVSPVVEEESKPESEEKEKSREGFLITQIFSEWRTFINVNADEYDRIMCLKNRCMSSLLLMLIFCGFGGLIFRFTEGAFESFYKCGVKRVKRDFIDTLWSNSQYMLEDDWKSQARRKLMEFENQLHTAHEAGMTTYSGQKSWSFLNAVVYCLTVVTTIGYGHISPSTATGRAITIIYAIFGIPMFLILLADFGKLFTRGIKFVWAFVRRLYYTGSCRKVRKTAPVQEVMKGVQLVYDFAKNRRPSQITTTEEDEQQQTQLKPPEATVQFSPETPSTPAISTFEVDDEFNLPVSVAFTILLIYIFFGATIYSAWEEWTFFESFYFVFISMSTIGFGDFVPQHPMYMMASIVYLVFGLALTSMCINVVQEKLSDTFRQASVKIGTTIGLKVEDDGSVSAPAELASVNPIDEEMK